MYTSVSPRLQRASRPPDLSLIHPRRYAYIEPLDLFASTSLHMPFSSRASYIYTSVSPCLLRDSRALDSTSKSTLPQRASSRHYSYLHNSTSLHLRRAPSSHTSKPHVAIPSAGLQRSILPRFYASSGPSELHASASARPQRDCRAPHLHASVSPLTRPAARQSSRAPYFLSTHVQRASSIHLHASTLLHLHQSSRALAVYTSYQDACSAPPALHTSRRCYACNTRPKL